MIDTNNAIIDDKNLIYNYDPKDDSCFYTNNITNSGLLSVSNCI